MQFTPNLELTDLNGEVWAFSSRDCPVRIRTVTGLEGAPFSFDTTTGVGMPGVIVNARDDKASVVEFDVWVGPVTKGPDAVGLLQTFINGLGRGWARNGQMLLLKSLDTERFQQARLAEPIESPNWAQMFHVGRTSLKFKLQSDESWWRTDPVDVTFTPAGFAAAAVANGGDEDSWPWFKLTGPITNPKLGLVDEEITIPFNLSAGQTLEIQTDPDWWQVTDQTGADRTWSIGDRWRQKAPARTPDIDVNISGTGTTAATSLRVVVPQLFHGAR